MTGNTSSGWRSAGFWGHAAGGRELEGTHDFRSFCSLRKMKKSSVRTIFRIGILEDFERERAELIFEGNGFLYHMVRILTGTLLEVGGRPGGVRKRCGASWRTEDRGAADLRAPPQGLFLEKVWYSEEEE